MMATGGVLVHAMPSAVLTATDTDKTPSIVYDESGSIGTTLDPPIFWMDNNFNALSKFYRL